MEADDLLKVVAAAILAVVLTAGLAIVWDLLAPRVQGPGDLEELVGEGPVIRVRRASREHFRPGAPDRPRRWAAVEHRLQRQPGGNG